MTTAHDDLAIRAFRYCAPDYQLKPIDPEALIAAIRKMDAFMEIMKDGVLKQKKPSQTGKAFFEF